MENEGIIDMSNVSIDDVKVGGVFEPKVEDATPVTETTETPVTETAPVTETPVAEAPVVEEVIENLVEIEDTTEPAVITRANERDESQAPAPKSAYEWVEQDDFIKNLLAHYKATGSAVEYLQAATVDYTNMPADRLIKLHLKEQYPTLSEAHLDKLYEKQYVDKYQADEEKYGEEAELGRQLLEAEAQKLRSEFVTRQQQFIKQAPNVAVETEDTSEADQQEVIKFQQTVQNAPQTKSLVTDKRIVMEFEGKKFGYEVEPDAIIHQTLDPQAFFQQFQDPQGQINWNKWYEAAAYAQNPDKFKKALINYGKNLGRKEVTEVIKNPSTPTQPGGTPTQSSGDFFDGLANAFANHGVVKKGY
jgi:hypothetical protein